MKTTYGKKKRLANLLALAMLLTSVQGNFLIAAPVTSIQVFSDVKENLWYTGAINKWGQNNIIKGYADGSFKPKKEVTRAELAAIIVRVFGLTDAADAKSYNDVKQNEWYTAVIEKVSSAGIMNDEGAKFNPNQPATREEVAYAVANAYKITGGNSKTFKDQTAISDWALSHVNALAEGKYIMGRPGGEFAPKDKITRAEMVAIIDRMTAELIQTSGTYTQDVEGNVVINTKDVVLENMIISGNLYLAPGIGTGDVTLKKVTVKGETYVDGGGVDSIKMYECILENSATITSASPVRVVSEGGKISIIAKEGTQVFLTGVFNQVQIPAGVKLELKGATIEKLTVIPSKTNPKARAEIKIDDKTTVKILQADAAVTIMGKGTIIELIVNALNVKSEIRAEKVSGSEKAEITSNNSGGGSTGGGNTGNDSDKEVDKKWKLTWSDEFEGTALNPDNWVYNNGFLDLNEEKQVYKSENAEVSDGILKIIAKKEQTTIGNTTHDYTSARILTRGKYAQKYGKVEVRAKLPVGKSLWPAIWMMPENEEYTGWPSSGEIDIMESKGSEPNKVWGTLHYGDKRPNNLHSGSQYDFPEGQRIDQFHTYGIEWEPGEMRWYIDGQLYQTQDNWHTVSPETGEIYAYPAPFDKEFYLILNLALGGWYDGVGAALEVDDSIFDGGKEHAMEVDYVRFYESLGWSYKEVEDPATKATELPKDARPALTDGNLIYDNTYAQYGIKDNKNANLNFGDGWNLVHNDSFGADASASIQAVNTTPFAKIDINDGGNQSYSVQMIQLATVGRGKTYKLSFDAKADANRDIQFKVGGGESRGYEVYSGNYTESLTTQVKRIEKTFTMKVATDIAARVEFNLGLNSNAVWIGNVRLEEVIGGPVEEEDFNTAKEPLLDGNLIYNGAFDKGKIDRLTYWDLTNLNGASSSMVVPETSRNLNINIQQGGIKSSDVILDQRGLKLTNDRTYNVSFSGKAESSKIIKVKLVGEDGQTIYAEEEVTLSSHQQNYQFKLIAKHSSTTMGRLVFELGGNTTNVCLDNIKVVESREDFSNVEIFPLKNGNFSQGSDFWEGSTGVNGNYSITDKANFTINSVGANTWDVMLNQLNMPFAAGVKYVISFDASSTIARDIIVKTEEENTWIEFFKQTVRLTPETQRFTFEYTMPASDRTLGLKFMLGAMPNTPTTMHDIVIDNVVCEVKDGKFLKSIIQNGRFDKGMESWGYWVAPENGAQANISVEDKELKVAINALGSNPWEVQVSQKGIKFEKGKTYQVGFKVKSDDATKLKMSIGGVDSNWNFTSYLTEDQIFNVTSEQQEQYFQFTMTHDTDTNANVFFDAGKLDETSALTTFYIDDVYVIEISATDNDKDPDDNNEAMPKVNLLKNGDFEDLDNYVWYSWVNSPAGAAITTGSVFTVDIVESGDYTSAITLAQDGIALVQGEEYILSFEAQVATASSLRISILNSNGEEYTGEYSTTVNLTPEQSDYQIAFTVSKDTDANLTFRMEMGGDEWSPTYSYGTNNIVIDHCSLTLNQVQQPTDNTIYLDDLSIVEKDSTEIINVLKDGDFSSAGAWISGGGATFNFDEAAKVVITNAGTNPWDVILFQSNVALENGKTYIVSFKGKSDRAKVIRLLTSNASYADYFSKDFALTSEMTEYSFEFTVNMATSNALEFKVFMGGGI